MDFWKRNYGFRLSALQRQWKESYISTPKGRAPRQRSGKVDSDLPFHFNHQLFDLDQKGV
jgi:hypothetical protein